MVEVPSARFVNAPKAGSFTGVSLVIQFACLLFFSRYAFPGTVFSTLLLPVVFGAILVGWVWFQLKLPEAISEEYWVDGSGIYVTKSEAPALEINWEHVRSVEYSGNQERCFVNYFTPDGQLTCFTLPLNQINPDISEDFVKTLRHYWPDLDQPWQDQVRARNGLDSGAG